MNTINHSFHSATYQLLGFAPEISSAFDHILMEAEKRLGAQLPQSVREWYRHHDAIRILAEHSSDDPPVAVESFELVEWQSRRLVPIRNENQGVCTWAVELDGSDDPAVYVDVDTGGKDWQLMAPTFSQYAFSCVWDYSSVLHRPALVQAQNRVLGDAALNALSTAFQQEVQTHGWPGNTQYRFISEQGAVLIWASEQQADWFIGASNAHGLESVLRTIWDLDDVGPILYAASNIGDEVLTRLREGKRE